MTPYAILLASLLGSLHCVAMCGGFVACYASSTHGGSRVVGHALYSLGRLLTYGLLGFIAGSAGGLLDSAEILGMQRFSAVATGIILLTSGIGMFKREGVSGGVSWIPGLSKLYRSVLSSQAISGAGKALLLGVMSTLLPCGWLYSFVAVAAGSGDPVEGIFVMFVFWLGTLPVLLSWGGLLRPLLARLGERLPRVVAILVILAGLWSIYAHIGGGGGGHHHH